MPARCLNGTPMIADGMVEIGRGTTLPVLSHLQVVRAQKPAHSDWRRREGGPSPREGGSAPARVTSVKFLACPWARAAAGNDDSEPR